MDYFVRNLKKAVLGTFIVTTSLICIQCKREIAAIKSTNSNIRILNGGQTDRVHKVRRTSDGGFIFSGETTTGNSNPQAFLLKADANGNTEWYKTYGDSLEQYFNACIQTSDGGYMAIGATTMTGAASFSTMDWVVKTNAHGEVEWEKSFSLGNYALCELTDLIEGSDNMIYATGFYPSTMTWMASWLLKFDLHGKMTYSRAIEGLNSYPPKRFDANNPLGWGGGFGITENNNGDILIASQLVIYSQNTQTVPGILSMKKNAAVNFYYPYFEVKNSNPYAPKGHHQDLKVLDAGNGSYLGFQSDTTINGNTSTCIKLLKTDNAGNMQWVKGYRGMGHTILFDMIKLPSGEIYLAGMSSKSGVIDNLADKFSDAVIHIAKLNSNGDLMNEFYIGNTTNINGPKCLQILNDGSISIAGFSANNNGSHKMFVMKSKAGGKF